MANFVLTCSTIDFEELGPPLADNLQFCSQTAAATASGFKRVHAIHRGSREWAATITTQFRGRHVDRHPEVTMTQSIEVFCGSPVFLDGDRRTPAINPTKW
jgi:hypothetical protein